MQMTWKNLEQRFATWFALAVAAGNLHLADRIALVTMRLRSIDRNSSLGLSALLDEIDAAPASARPELAVTPSIESVICEFEAMLRNDDDAAAYESLGPYRADRSAASRRRTKLVMEIPSASHTALSSSTSRRRSPDSYLLTND